MSLTATLPRTCLFRNFRSTPDAQTTRKAAGAKDGAAKGGRAKKDKNAPKRALSAYMFFSQDWRERIKTENPDAGFGMCFFTTHVLNW